MKSRIIESVKKDVKHWWTSLITGILAIILGIWCLVTPDNTLVALTYVFIFTFFISGIVEIIFAAANRHTIRGWGWSLAGGIIDIIFGLLLLIIPLPILTTILIYFVGFWILFRAIGSLTETVELQQLGVRGWGWSLAFSILAILFAFFFLISPVIFQGAFIIAFVSIALFVYGIFKIALAFNLRTIKKKFEKVKDGFSELKNEVLGETQDV